MTSNRSGGYFADTTDVTDFPTMAPSLYAGMITVRLGASGKGAGLYER